jgi:hypothetical protein
MNRWILKVFVSDSSPNVFNIESTCKSFDSERSSAYIVELLIFCSKVDTFLVRRMKNQEIH